MANEHRRHLTVPVSFPQRRSRSPTNGLDAQSPSSYANSKRAPSPVISSNDTSLDHLLRAAERRCGRFEQRVARLQDILDHGFENWRSTLREHEELNDELTKLADLVSHTSTRELPQTLARLGSASRETRGVGTQLDGMGRRIVETENRLKEGRRRMERLERLLSAQEAGRGWLTWTNIIIGSGALVVSIILGILLFYLITSPTPSVPSTSPLESGPLPDTRLQC